MAEVKLGKMENAPEWYNKPFEEQRFEWSVEEELMLKRWCEKIEENCAEEEMTPMERFRATFEKKDKDRLHIECKYNAPYAVRCLDSWADAIKPGDLYQRPKLHIMGHLAMAARFKLDIINIYVIHYTEECWGGDGRMIDYGTPQMVGEPPIKTMDDLEAVDVPDPYKHSLYPGYLWAAREIKRIMKEYNVADKLPVELSFCGDPLGTMFLGMTGFGPGTVMMKKNPELFEACMRKAAEFQRKFGKACKDQGPDAIYMCSFMGAFPPKTKKLDNTFIMDIYGDIGKDIKSHLDPIPQWHTLGANGWEPWMELYYPAGAVGPGSFDGWWVGPEMDPAWAHAYAREKDLYCGCSVDDHLVLDGRMSEVEELLKARTTEAKKHPKHMQALGVLDYWTPMEIVDQLFDMTKKLGKF